MENLPNKLDATCRQGATFGPVYLQVAGIDLTGYSLSGGVGAKGAVPTLDKISATEFSVTFGALLTGALPSVPRPDVAGGESPWWVDAVAPDGAVVPLIGGTLTVVSKGGHD